MEWVQICHPELPYTEESPGLVTREAYEQVHKGQSWRLHVSSHLTSKKPSKEK